MDVNAIWVPQALESMDRILTALDTLGFPADKLAAYARGNEMDTLLRHARDRAGLRAAIVTWRGARRHFEVVLTADEARNRARASLAQMSPIERNFWQSRLDTLQPGADVRFLAVALDSIGRPIPVVNTDAATRLFLEDPGALAARASETMGDLGVLMMPYPLGLFVPELGPLVANDVYAAPPVREAFRADLYHSPRVTWGREVNLLLLGLARNITAAYDGTGRLRDPSLAPYVERLREALARTIAAVEASGLKHNELWSYRVEDNRLLPIRYGASTDIQLWNLTDLAVQFALDRLPVSAGDSPAGEYDDLVTLFAEWREFESPEIVDGVPDYTPAAMATQYAELARWKARLEALDPTDWSVPDQIDWHLVRAEMNGLDFDHRVRQPWTRDPAFYVTIFPSESDVPAHEGPVIHGWIDLWKYEYPLSAAAAAELARRIGAIPALLEQARGNLTGNARDLWLAGLRSFRGQSADLAAFGERVAGTEASLDAAIAAAREASDAFHAWLEEQAPSKTASSGVGRDNYTWYMRNVHLVPYSWEEMVTLMRRELARAHASLRLEENRNRHLPPLERIVSAEEYDRRMNEAVTDYMRFLEEEEIHAIREWMDPALRAVNGRFTPAAPGEIRNFFGEVTYRDPLAMRTHMHHWIELARMREEPHTSPIRRVPSLYNIFDHRSEGLATGVEEMFMHAGLFDERPRTRELIWIMLAQRAARALSGLYLHGNEFTMEEAVEHATRWTPRGWLPDGDLVRNEQHLYLRQPGYGTSYLSGKIQIEELMAERALQLGDAFTIGRFFDEFFAVGVIPVSLVRWELTGSRDAILR
jgi:hypothetical protein